MSQTELVPVSRISTKSKLLVPDRRAGAVSAPEPPLLEIQHLIFSEAVRLGASDIHIEPGRRQTRVRYRIDGLMLHTLELPRWLHQQLVARIKVMARLDITERRLPQDGHIVDRSEGIDGRLSTMPTEGGEALVVRIFRDREYLPTIAGLGAGRAIETQLKAISRRPQGIVIVAGPTGSGKTTTLFALIDELRNLPLNILTIEDPVEYRVDGIRQIQVDQKSQLTFHRALRSVLRQDPDVILVGEMRDSETAHIAFEAALTGHLVLSTLHATDAPSILLRLEELGVDTHVVAAAMIGAVAQRLVRRNCPHCLGPDLPAVFYLERLGITASEASRLRRSHGCAECRFTGVDGRIPLFEVIELNRDTRKCVVTGNESELRRVAVRSGYVPVLDQARELVLAGTVAIDEAYRTCYFGDVQ
jgi:type IV pilus assembly protein PilB